MIKLIFEKKEEGTNSFKPEYEIRYLLNGSYIKLDTSICNNIIEDINNKIPTFSLHDNLDGLFELNPMSNHYDDICYTTTTENSTDMPLLDRKNDFCGENCVPYYNINNNSIKCTCFINNKTQNIEDKSEKDKLLENFVEVSKFANLHLLRCYKKVFKLNNLKNNYGFFINIFILASYILCLLLFRFKFYLNLKNEISKLIYIKESTFKSGNDGKNLKTRKFNSKIKLKKEKKKSKRKKFGNPPLKKKLKNSKSKFMTTQETIKSKTSYKKESVLEYNSDEFNSLSYEDALIFDKRNFCQYYCSLLKLNHIIIFSFYCNSKDYNSQIIKIFLFFFSFGADIAISALFYKEDFIHNINEKEGKYDHLIIELYTSLISSILDTVLKYLAFTDNLVLDIKFEKKIEEFKKKKQSLYTKIKIRYILFFIISFLFISFFLFYVSCFCGIYVNSQFDLIRDALMSLFITAIILFYHLLFPGIFRICALRAKNKNKKCLYGFSQFLEMA